MGEWGGRNIVSLGLQPLWMMTSVSITVVFRNKTERTRKSSTKELPPRLLIVSIITSQSTRSSPKLSFTIEME